MTKKTDTLFNKTQVARSFARAAQAYDEAAIMQQEVGRRLLERLELMTIEPQSVVDLGSGSGALTQALAAYYPAAKITACDLSQEMLHFAKTQQHAENITYLAADVEQLPLATNSVDMVFSNMMLHWANDLAAALTEIARVLKPGGLLLFSTLGPDSLYELRDSWAVVDDQPHVHPFIDMHHIGDALMAAPCDDPVMDTENLTLLYKDTIKLMRDLQAFGGRNIQRNRSRTVTGKQALRTMQQAYEQFRTSAHKLPVTYEVIYGHAWGTTRNVRRQDGVGIQLDQIAGLTR